MSGWVNALPGFVGPPLSYSLPPSACQVSVWSSPIHPLQLGSLMGLPPSLCLPAACQSFFLIRIHLCLCAPNFTLCSGFCCCWSAFSPSLFSFVALWRWFTLPQWVVFHPVRMNKAHPMHKNRFLFSRTVSVQLWAGLSFSASLRMRWLWVLLQQQIFLHVLCCQPCVSL